MAAIDEVLAMTMIDDKQFRWHVIAVADHPISRMSGKPFRHSGRGCLEKRLRIPRFSTGCPVHLPPARLMATQPPQNQQSSGWPARPVVERKRRDDRMSNLVEAELIWACATHQRVRRCHRGFEIVFSPQSWIFQSHFQT